MKSEALRLSDRIGVKFRNEKILEVALTHKSFSYEQTHDEKKPPHNEKLEFLGDAVLDLILSEYLMETFPDSDEGPLSKMRAHLVNEAGLSQIAQEIGLQNEIRLGKGEIQSQGAFKPRLLASCLEALMGACFADLGYETTKTVVRSIFAKRLEELKASVDFDNDYKSQLQEKIQAESKQTPVYELKSSQGPAHDRLFEVCVKIGSEEIAIGQGKSKKAAEQNAAEKGLMQLLQRNQK